jgi:uncharacterized repeat protein (TIGR03803 family)
MPNSGFSPKVIAAGTIVFAVLLAAGTGGAAAQEENLLYSFLATGQHGPQVAGLIFDSAGNLYGTNPNIGKYGLGAVYELVNRNGVWEEKVLHSFDYSAQGAFTQLFSSLIFDTAGNLYGTMYIGGAYGCGGVFETSPQNNGIWTTRLLHSFKDDGKDGCAPMGAVIFDASGNLYGTTQSGGVYGKGTAFELVQGAGGAWAERIIHNFGNGRDGSYPQAALIFDGAGSLYGTTYYGGSMGNSVGNGTVFELSPASSGKWMERILYDFTISRIGANGSSPAASLIFDAAGNLYGTTISGGPGNGRGVAFELTPTASGLWTETILHTFNVGDGWNVEGNLVFDTLGNLYGTTVEGGLGTDPAGTVFELFPSGAGTWSETILYTFIAGNPEGIGPNCGLILDSSGNLYGTTGGGGSGEGGTVFEITP